ncbi:MAG: hypothetical protein V3T17_10565 [Pseudomonadales bacterium]
MLKLAQFTQCLLCLVSMMLTGLFALSFSGFSVVDIEQGGGGKAVFIALLFVTLGCCIDIGKYLFWFQRQRSYAYGIISLTLTVFSLLASYAFFISSEFNVIKDVQPTTVEYLAVQQQLASTRQEIAYYESLLNKRLKSAYHQQWQEAEKNTVKIRQLNDELTVLTAKLPDAGLRSAQRQVPATQVFVVVSHVLNSTKETVSNMAYGLLALLLEVSTLGCISLVSALRAEKRCLHDGEDLGAEAVKGHDYDEGLRQKVVELSRDIINGTTPPVLRKIRAAHYGLDIDVIRSILNNLYLAGVLDTDKRKSFKLSKAH